MLINGVTEYARDGKEQKTALVVGRATGDGEVKHTQSGKSVASVSVKAFGRKDGSAAFITVKTFNEKEISKVSSLRKGDSFLAAGRLDSREYNGKTYTDLLADFVATAGGQASPMDVLADRVDKAFGENAGGGDFAEIGDEGELPF